MCRPFCQVTEFQKALEAVGVRVTTDTRDNYTPGWKYNHWELKGLPLRMELGPKDLDNQTVVLARRDTGAKEFVGWADIATRVSGKALYSRHTTTTLRSVGCSTCDSMCVV